MAELAPFALSLFVIPMQVQGGVRLKGRQSLVKGRCLVRGEPQQIDHQSAGNPELRLGHLQLRRRFRQRLVVMLGLREQPFRCLLPSLLLVRRGGEDLDALIHFLDQGDSESIREAFAGLGDDRASELFEGIMTRAGIQAAVEAAKAIETIDENVRVGLLDRVP